VNDFMVAVERAVRPVRAVEAHKDRMREELLAHLTGVYEEERARRGDDAAARAAALERFGDPATLTAELQGSVSPYERFEASCERMTAWRPSETTNRYLLRLTGGALLVSLALSAPLWAAAAVREGLRGDVLARLALAMAFLVVTCIDIFLLGHVYVRLRDALLGRSWLRTVVFAALFVLVLGVSGPAAPLLATWDPSVAAALLGPVWALPTAFGVLMAVVYALVRGPADVRHVEWVRLDIGR
jgi:hypothetical protein